LPTFASFKAYGDAVDRMQKDIESESKTVIARAMGERAQSIATSAASADIGGSFSGWKRGNPIELVTQIKTIRNGVAVIPTKVSAGPWTVANQGRNQGNAGGFAGPGINRSTGRTSRTKSGGLRKVRATKAKRWNGTTRGFHTADQATARMDHELPRMADVGVKRIMVRHFDVS
jgi:hypothetical protein